MNKIDCRGFGKGEMVGPKEVIFFVEDSIINEIKVKASPIGCTTSAQLPRGESRTMKNSLGNGALMVEHAKICLAPLVHPISYVVLAGKRS